MIAESLSHVRQPGRAQDTGGGREIEEGGQQFQGEDGGGGAESGGEERE